MSNGRGKQDKKSHQVCTSQKRVSWIPQAEPNVTFILACFERYDSSSCEKGQSIKQYCNSSELG